MKLIGSMLFKKYPRALIFFIGCISLVFLSPNSVVGQIWSPDNGDGTFTNPIMYADYSDPDVIRVDDDFYMIASSFNAMPGIPILHSTDLVNWEIVNHVYNGLPLEKYNKVQPGQGSWAPSIRFHDGTFYIYFCTPEDGLFLATAKDPKDKWDLKHVLDVYNWEDPCPFWDDDGKAYLLRGAVGAGPAILHRMSSDGSKILDDGKVIFLDSVRQPILEGFKFMEKKDGFYYFSAPAGGVGEGWQSIFRSKNIYGPYEDKIVLAQGSTDVNGPHQGGFVKTLSGEEWFIHFQQKGIYGRIVHLEPVTWSEGWPVIGKINSDQDTGEPVHTYKMPKTNKKSVVTVPQTSDEFLGNVLGLQWQWQANFDSSWYSLNDNGYLRLRAVANPNDSGNLLYAPNVLLQKVPGPDLSYTTKLSFVPDLIGDKACLAVMGRYATYLCVEKEDENQNQLSLFEADGTGRKKLPQKRLFSTPIKFQDIWMKVSINKDNLAQYSYSTDGVNFTPVENLKKVTAGVWIGAKVGIVCESRSLILSKGYADFDFFRVN